ncbi:Scr1 family TA system antitoxin-like transcriptional regulator [Streptomyces sp. CA-181903]|uniref:Scr1 family TA system antitoxin-like transcriptional regulator n=1 Tax=Streptomyces sp. CA-181903 TaxID=3240055 RepID=UPI003D90BC8A
MGHPSLLRRRRPPELVYLEHLNSAQYLTRPREIDQYRHVLNRLSSCAAGRKESERLLEKAIAEFG